ncbi:hypothetical protein [Rhizobium oryzicola]|uniref:Flagellar basal body-associated FliL family protein n=1 Tax=Rhizobium oryzicola TaxID=1232668 RepID=A0ABT8SS16_9HYPH|nr:hypothetical protein [Rhizobium oryzicola]MDO1581045.1 hypothetical protein [Rhizobium oryzicola]
MIKLLLTGLWVCAVTLGAVYFSVQMSAPKPPVDEAALKKEQSQLVKGETINVPMLANGSVQGYFITRISFMMDKEKVKDVQLPVTELMTDQLFTLLVGNKMVNLSNPAAFKLDDFRSMVKEGLNKKLGDAYINEVLVEQLDYLSKDDIRNNGERPPSKQVKATKIVEGVKVQEPEKAGH